MEMNWRLVYFGKVKREDVQKYIPEEAWQEVRLDIKGKSLEYKYLRLLDWLKRNNNSHSAQVQCTNYVTALSRGGLIKPHEYRDK